jgi:predicted PurR-regulated permease PerM
MAAVLALVFMPCCVWLERQGMKKIFASIICGLIFIFIMAGIIALLIWHVKSIAGNLSDLGHNLSSLAGRAQQYLHDKLGLATPKQGELLTSPQPETVGGSNMAKTVTTIMSVLANIAINLILIVVYMIMLLCQRHRFKEFVLSLVPVDTQSQTKMILIRSVRVVQHYLFGLGVVIACLWVMYSIGFSVIGIKNAIFFAILCGLLEIVPFVGNLTGSTLTSLMALSQGGGFSMVLGVLGTYALIQFIQFYIISPLVMRAQLNINPLFTIFILIAGELIWGIPGMILAIPFLGIAKILFDNIKPLQPLGCLIGREKTTTGHTPWFTKLKTRFYKMVAPKKVAA